MDIINLSEQDSVLHQYLREVRSVDVQGDPLRFRRNLERIGWLMAYEISQRMHYADGQVTTPLGSAPVRLVDERVVVATILRAGLPFHQGFLDCFDRAENAFVSAYRKYEDERTFDIHIEYIASPRLDGKTLLLVDPMLATGGSMELAYRALLTKGTPAHVHVATIIASRQAVDYIADRLPADRTTLWAAAIDPHINAHSYIVPGLGDAGDLAYGEKE